MKGGDLSKGIKLPNGMDIRKDDTKILAVTKNLQQDNKEIPTILVSKDLYMCIKANALGITVEDYKYDKVDIDEVYKGYTKIMRSSLEINKIYEGGLLLPKDIEGKIYPNEFLHIVSNDKSNHEVILGI